MRVPRFSAVVAHLPLVCAWSLFNSESAAKQPVVPNQILDAIDSSSFVPNVSLNVAGIKLYPAAPNDGQWIFTAANGDICSLQYGSVCCNSDCIDVPDTTSKVRLGNTEVSFEPLPAQPFPGSKTNNLASFQSLLGDFNSDILDNLDKAVAKMFDFALSVIAHSASEDQPRNGTKRLDHTDALSEAIAAIDRVLPVGDLTTPAGSKSLPRWVQLMDRLILHMGQGNKKRSPDSPNLFNPSAVRAMTNRMQWLRSLDTHLTTRDVSGPSKDLQVAALLVLHDLGADAEFLGLPISQFSLTSPGSIITGMEAFANQMDLHESLSSMGNTTTGDLGRDMRSSLIVLEDDTSPALVKTFYHTLDRAEGRQYDGVMGYLYHTSLSRRHRALVRNMGSVSHIYEQELAKDVISIRKYSFPPGGNSTTTKSGKKARSKRPHGKPDRQGPPRNRKLKSRIPPDPLEPQPDSEDEVATQLEAPIQLKRVSEKRGGAPVEEQDFKFHESAGGDDIIVFVADSGLAHDQPRVREELDLPDTGYETYIWETPLEGCVPPDVNPNRIVNAHDVCLNYQNEGHGTPSAALAVGSEFGVAKKSTIFSLKVMCAWYEPEEHNEDLVVTQATTPTAMLLAFQRIGEIVRGNNLAAKAVVVLPQAVATEPGSQNDRNLETAWRRILTMTREEGIVVVGTPGSFAVEWIHDAVDENGNCVWSDVPKATWNRYPEIMQVHFPEIVIGASTTPSGAFAHLNSPHMTEWSGEWVYAQGWGILSMDADGDDKLLEGDGFGAPIVAGLAAYFLGHPSYRPHIWDGTNKQVVAPRIKRLLKLAAWERLPNGDLRTRLGFVGPVGECNNLDEMYDTYPHDVPEWIPMVYNGVHGYQGDCIRETTRRAIRSPQDGGEVPDPNDPFGGDDLVCKRRPGNATATTTSAAPLPPSTQLPDWEDIGCFDNAADGLDAVQEQLINDPQLNLEGCARHCPCANMFGVRNGNECFCIQEQTHIVSGVVDGAQCNVPCGGNGQQMCGGQSVTRLYLNLVGFTAEDQAEERCKAR